MFQIGDRIVYPMHGAGVIEAIEEKEILGQKKSYFVINLNNMRLMFPMESNLGIRQVVDSNILEDVLNLFQEESDPIPNPALRSRMYMNKIKSGNIYEGVQVIRDLIRMGKKRTLATGDKMMLDNAKQIFISELMLVKGIAQEQAVHLLNEAIHP
ncbi:CarD family transcriptional regulator [Caldalkalibacillus mannanilyticus]|uniref:CarD family transcriptional regulator n=1 Tax=Caldalkalibacillus mannanilyticus TaxID=1418 RepID=UPI00046A69B7|nr:CarD family transcriptional regulator [Caldalkalibacillus mannanilyticus]